MTDLLGPYALGRVHHADCRDGLAALPDESVQCCVTSPPYWGLRKYDLPDMVWGAGPAWPGGPPCEHWFEDCGARTVQPKRDHGHGGFENATGTRGEQGHNAGAGGSRSLGSFCRICGAWRGQLGLEPTPALFVEHLVGIFRAVRRVLRDDGTLWLNIGDCYATTPPGCNGVSQSTGLHGGRTSRAYRETLENSVGQKQNTIVPGVKPKDLIGVPWLLAFALRADGWYLRAEIIWHKTAPMPESVRDRPTRAHEQVFLLSKAERYFYNEAEAKETSSGTAHARGDGVNPKAAAAGDDKLHVRQNASYSGAINKLVDSRNWRTVWTIGPEPNNAQHYAPFPRELARRCIVAGSKAGDVVLDPFAGTGTTVRVADGLGRKALGFDLGEKYVAAANERSGEVRPETAKPNQQIGLLRWDERQGDGDGGQLRPECDGKPAGEL